MLAASEAVIGPELDSVSQPGESTAGQALQVLSGVIRFGSRQGRGPRRRGSRFRSVAMPHAFMASVGGDAGRMRVWVGAFYKGRGRGSEQPRVGVRVPLGSLVEARPEL